MASISPLVLFVFLTLLAFAESQLTVVDLPNGGVLGCYQYISCTQDITIPEYSVHSVQACSTAACRDAVGCIFYWNPSYETCDKYINCNLPEVEQIDCTRGASGVFSSTNNYYVISAPTVTTTTTTPSKQNYEQIDISSSLQTCMYNHGHVFCGSVSVLLHTHWSIRFCNKHSFQRSGPWLFRQRTFV